jgi:hypothetical protein
MNALPFLNETSLLFFTSLIDEHAESCRLEKGTGKRESEQNHGSQQQRSNSYV